MTKNKTICIIPARGGSKRLPEKNLRVLGNHPLIGLSILYAQKHNWIDSVYVTTDDEAIIKVAKHYGAKIIVRPKSLSGDTATTVSALKHVLETVNEQFETVILLQPTNPLRPKTLLNDAYTSFLESNCDSLMSVSRNQQKLGKIVNNHFKPFNYTMGQRSQDLEPLYNENGLLYISKTKLILEDKILGANNLPYVVEHPYADIDIDTEADFQFAEFILKQYPND